MQMLAFLLARFSEPSSYAGLGAVLALAGIHFSDSELGQLAQFLAAGCGLAALVLKERGAVQAIAIALLLGGTLSACAPPVAAGAGIGAAASGLAVAGRIVDAADTALQIACGEYQKGRAAADAVGNTGVLPADIVAKVRVIEEYGNAACANPPPGDALSTAIWLGELVGQIASLTAVPATQP